MATVEITQDNFQETIEGDNVVLLDFWAEWCGPCRSFAPIFEAVSNNHADVVFGKVNTEEQRQLAEAYNIRSIPTLTVFRERIVLFSQAGVLSAAQLEDLVKKAVELDMDEVREEIRKQSE